MYHSSTSPNGRDTAGERGGSGNGSIRASQIGIARRPILVEPPIQRASSGGAAPRGHLHRVVHEPEADPASRESVQRCQAVALEKWVRRTAIRKDDDGRGRLLGQFREAAQIVDLDDQVRNRCQASSEELNAGAELVDAGRVGRLARDEDEPTHAGFAESTAPERTRGAGTRGRPWRGRPGTGPAAARSRLPGRSRRCRS